MEVPALKQFYVATRNLREVMDEDLYLNDFDRISLENYIALLQMTYINWKRRNVQFYRRAVENDSVSKNA
jgi:hypothetical protein